MKDADEQALKLLLKYFARKKYSSETVKRWTVTAVEFIVFLEHHGKTVDDIGDLLNSEGKVVQREPFGVKDFFDTKAKYEASYLNNLHHVLKRFYIAWERHFPISNEEFPKVKKEPKRPTLATEDILKIAEAARDVWIERTELHSADLVGLRDYTIMLIGIDCGARRYQISKINAEHYDHKKGTLFIPAAKGGRNTKRVIADEVKNVLVYYLQRRLKIDTTEPAMFLSMDGKRMGIDAMKERFRIICKKAGVYEIGIGFHVFRRAKVWRMKKAGFTEEEINDVMGWKIGSRMSHVYGALDQEEVQQKAADADSIFKAKPKKDEPHTI